VLAGSTDIGHLFEAHRRRWRRRAKPAGAGRVRLDVEFEEADGYTIIDVYAADALGLLYRLTETMSRLGLDIHFARIATRGDGVVDAFYTLDKGGAPTMDEPRKAAVRGELLATLRDMTERELA